MEVAVSFFFRWSLLLIRLYVGDIRTVWQKVEVEDSVFNSPVGSCLGMDLDIVEVCASAVVGPDCFDKIDRVPDEPTDTYRLSSSRLIASA